jgi:integral membrane protein (TIGR01906 family)
MTRVLPRLLQWAVALALVVLLLAINLRIATGHWFVDWEYGKRSFPADEFGLTNDERARLAKVCVDYLATSADISLLAQLTLPGGEQAFNDRELEHMQDVQQVFDGIGVAGLVAGVVVVVGAATLWLLPGGRRFVPAALLTCSLLSLGLLITLGIYMTLNWSQFFTNFHRVFFEGDSWLFRYSDTLIRLFPMRFWIDVAAVLVGLLVVEAVALGAIGWFWSRSLRP